MGVDAPVSQSVGRQNSVDIGFGHVSPGSAKIASGVSIWELQRLDKFLDTPIARRLFRCRRQSQFGKSLELPTHRWLTCFDSSRLNSSVFANSSLFVKSLHGNCCSRWQCTRESTGSHSLRDEVLRARYWRLAANGRLTGSALHSRRPWRASGTARVDQSIQSTLLISKTPLKELPIVPTATGEVDRQAETPKTNRRPGTDYEAKRHAPTQHLPTFSDSTYTSFSSFLHPLPQSMPRPQRNFFLVSRNPEQNSLKSGHHPPMTRDQAPYAPEQGFALFDDWLCPPK